MNDENESALTYVGEKGLEEMMELLIKNGADVNITNDNKNTALILAAENGNFQMLQLISKSYENRNFIRRTRGNC